MFTMENCFYLLISQAVRYLRDPAVHPRDKQRMKQELSSELVSSLYRPASLCAVNVSCGRRLFVFDCHGAVPQREPTAVGTLGCANRCLFLHHLHLFGGGGGARVWKKLTRSLLLISEYAALQPVSLLPPRWPLFTGQWGSSLSPRKICLQAGSRGAGAFVSARAGLCPARAEIDPVRPLPPFPGLAAERFTTTPGGSTFAELVAGGRPVWAGLQASCGGSSAIPFNSCNPSSSVNERKAESGSLVVSPRAQPTRSICRRVPAGF